uniref:Acetyl-coenzyme A carboxylase carboxyl transferase subunit beta n=1 Tax=Sciadococcus taiwanensis TaxID=3028030 RepID=A0A9Y1I288_9RHOD|nr:acetyl-CoA carboxylase beta subunit [Sciadococcus taiwanensis]
MQLNSWSITPQKNSMKKVLKYHQFSNVTLWRKCEVCSILNYSKDLKKNQKVCPYCNYHFPISSIERIETLIDEGSWNKLYENLTSSDPLGFYDQKPYKNRLVETRKRTNLNEAVQTGVGKINKTLIALGIMDFRFMGGSMGSVVGEKITRLTELATNKNLPLFIICASGGARMQEGMLSLMQMAKIAAALERHKENNLLYIPILTSPTTGGVTASFAMLGDLIIAEPKALIGFAGRRVIEQTIKEELPNDFQSSEYLLKHGFIDLIVNRTELKDKLKTLLEFHSYK